MTPKPEILYCISRMPSSNSSKGEDFLNFIQYLSKEFSLNCFITQSLFLDEDMLGKISGMGASIIRLKEKKRRISAKDFLQKIISVKKYSYILFDSIYTAKYYFYFLKQLLPNVVFLFDIKNSQYIMELKMEESKNKDIFDLPPKIVVALEKELPVYSYFDALILREMEYEKFLLKEIQGPRIIRAAKKNFAEKIKSLKPKKVYFRSSEVGRIAYSGLYGKNIVNNINRRLIKEKNKKYILIYPEGSNFAPFFSERAVFCMESHRSNRIILPSSNIRLSKSFGVNAPSPEKVQDYKEFLLKHLIGNFAEWRIINYIYEPCMLIRSRLLDEIGLFDEKFKSIYYSFADYGFRTFQSGGRIILNNEVFVFFPKAFKPEKYFIYMEHRKLIDKWGIGNGNFIEQLPL